MCLLYVNKKLTKMIYFDEKYFFAIKLKPVRIQPSICYTVELTHASGDWLHYKLVMHVCMSLVASTLLASRRSNSICWPN